MERLDDCTSGIPEIGTLKFKDPVLAVEVCSKANPHSFYISTKDPDALSAWQQAINSASAWWTGKRE